MLVNISLFSQKAISRLEPVIFQTAVQWLNLPAMEDATLFIFFWWSLFTVGSFNLKDYTLSPSNSKARILKSLAYVHCNFPFGCVWISMSVGWIIYYLLAHVLLLPSQPRKEQYFSLPTNQQPSYSTSQPWRKSVRSVFLSIDIVNSWLLQPHDVAFLRFKPVRVQDPVA